MSRTPLPNRRQTVTTVTEWAGCPIVISVGLDSAGQVREVFADHAKVGSDIDATIDDGLVLLSILLQHGVSIQSIHGHLGRESTTFGAPAASVLGFIAEVAAGLEGAP